MWPLEKNAPPLGSHVFQAKVTIFELIQDISETNLLSKFHEDRTINVASRVKNAPPLGCHVFQANVTIFELIQDIIKTNLLTIFHQDWTINVASRVLTRFYYSLIKPYKEKCPAPWRPCFQANVTIFELIQDIIKTHLLTIFHQDWTINVTSRVLTRKNAPPLAAIYYDIIRMNLLTKFHEDWKINVASRVKNAPPLGSHVFQAKVTIFELIQDISGTNLLSKFHQDWTINVTSRVLTRKNAPPPWWPYIIRMNRLTEFHEDQTIIVASRVLTRFYYSLIKPYKEKCPAPWRPCFQANVTIFELIQDIIKTNPLTIFHQDWTINVTSREKCPAPGGHVFQPTGIIFELFHEDWKINVASRVLTKFYYSHI
ncbi:hypothetical protein DPMN_182226 [Dreissena polymorpha]|uniref:Uncharacterized protein n=1 Tax=Dreissena polymorpha TaxID=45954 RepID=A0A9D4DEC4_DREPO|nr:hypothetical protein DPMN_182226 [Dreissena polymorpha]